MKTEFLRRLLRRTEKLDKQRIVDVLVDVAENAEYIADFAREVLGHDNEPSLCMHSSRRRVTSFRSRVRSAESRAMISTAGRIACGRSAPLEERIAPPLSALLRLKMVD